MCDNLLNVNFTQVYYCLLFFKLSLFLRLSSHFGIVFSFGQSSFLGLSSFQGLSSLWGHIQFWGCPHFKVVIILDKFWEADSVQWEIKSKSQELVVVLKSQKMNCPLSFIASGNKTSPPSAWVAAAMRSMQQHNRKTKLH